MENFKIILVIIIIFILSPACIIFGIGYGLYEMEKEKSEMNSLIGKRVVVERDTLLITDKCWWDKTLQLSNGREVDFKLGKKLIILEK